MPYSRTNNLPKTNRNAGLIRENSLPTYEEATGAVQRQENGFRASSVPVPTIQDEVGFIAPTVPVPTTTQQHVHSYGRTNRYSPNRAPISQVSPRARDVERAINQTSMTRHDDPVVRRMAETVLSECQRAKDKREMKKVLNIFLALIAFIMFIVFMAVSKGRS